MPARPIPEGFHTVTPHLVVKGGPAALEFYKKAFGAEEVMRLGRLNEPQVTDVEQGPG